MGSVCNIIISCNLTLTTALPSTAYFFHGFTGSMAAVSSPVKEGYTAPPVSVAARLSLPALLSPQWLHAGEFPRSNTPILNFNRT